MTKTTPAITVGLLPRPAELTLSFDPERKYRPEGINEALRATLLGSVREEASESDTSMASLSTARCDICKKSVNMSVSLWCRCRQWPRCADEAVGSPDICHMPTSSLRGELQGCPSHCVPRKALSRQLQYDLAPVWKLSTLREIDWLGSGHARDIRGQGRGNVKGTKKPIA